MTEIAAPNFIVRATGALGTMPDLGKRPYRLKCRFQIPAGAGPRVLEKAKHVAAEQFIADMQVRGFSYIGESSRLPAGQRGFRMAFKGAHVEIATSVSRPRVLSAREMLPAVMQGAAFRNEDRSPVQDVPHFTQCEYHDYELSAVFLHDTILTEVPDAHEERRPS